MADKKVKIDLKSRLGRSSSSNPQTAGAALGAKSAPGGIAPPPGILTPGGIPAPLFGQRPKLDKSDPFAAVAAEEAAAARPAEIKVEISQDVVRAGKRGRIGLVIAAGITAVVGGVLGFVWGGQSEKDTQASLTVKGAHELASDIEKTNKDVKQIADKIGAANESIFKNKKFPDSFSKDLQGIKIGFSSADLAGRGIGRLKAQTLRNVVEYASLVQDLDKRRERLARMMEHNKPDILALLEAGEHPRMSYAVFMGKGDKGPVATFVKIKNPIEFDKSWPDNITLVASRGEAVEAERYKTGEPFVKQGKTQKDKPTIYATPVEPDGIAVAFPNDVGKRVEADLATVTTLIMGTPAGSAAADDEKVGVLKLGEDLIKDLNAIGRK